MDRSFPPCRAAGLARLAAFAPHSGRAYTAGRNADPGPDGEPAVSGLSPYLRRRLVLEQEAVAAARAARGASAEKFVQEVFWRSYWKGYLEQHPAIWTGYRVEVARAWDRVASEGGLRRVFTDATEGRTGIDCFDAWARELVATNWLHNHARMWFASIWTFTLRLPWALGADFFARHLIDGDPASNTLSWRWVAGLHTRGKPYVARADNIARYTDGRFNPAGQLDERPLPLDESQPAPLVPLPPPDPQPEGAVSLLLHDEDCEADSLDLGGARVEAVAGFAATAGMARHGVADRVAAFTRGALEDGLGRAAARFGVTPVRLDAADVAAWVGANRAVVTPYAPLGPAAEVLADLPLRRLWRGWDRAAWPHARRGFFQLAERIPSILAAIGVATSDG